MDGANPGTLSRQSLPPFSFGLRPACGVSRTGQWVPCVSLVAYSALCTVPLLVNAQFPIKARQGSAKAVQSELCSFHFGVGAVEARRTLSRPVHVACVNPGKVASHVGSIFSLSLFLSSPLFIIAPRPTTLVTIHQSPSDLSIIPPHRRFLHSSVTSLCQSQLV